MIWSQFLHSQAAVACDFATEGFKILKIPARTPIANAFAQRWIEFLRRELLDRTILSNQRQLERFVIDHIDHHNSHRPHRSLNQRPPTPTRPDRVDDDHLAPLRVLTTTRCDGLINDPMPSTLAPKVVRVD